MPVFKINKTEDYSIISNKFLKEEKMSLKAKGLLAVMLSLPEKWVYSIDGLVSICKEEESAIKSTLKELKQFGYLTVEKKMPNETKTGRIEYIYNIYELPHTKQAIEKQGVENQPLEFQGVENQPQYNIDNKELKIKESNIYKDIIDCLNSATSSNYRYQSKATQRLINARLNDGFTVDDFKAVIDKKAKEWKGTEMAQYLRPETLFGTKFESYLNAPNASRKTAQATFNERTYTKEELDKVVTPIDELANIEW